MFLTESEMNRRPATNRLTVEMNDEMDRVACDEVKTADRECLPMTDEMSE